MKVRATACQPAGPAGTLRSCGSGKPQRLAGWIGRDSDSGRLSRRGIQPALLPIEHQQDARDEGINSPRELRSVSAVPALQTGTA